jgi:lipoate-protein ligase A
MSPQQRQWRFINTERNDAAWNMALDEAMLLLHDEEVTPPTLRVYGWSTPTLSLGYAQKTAQEVNLVACQQYGVAVVRRPTGGRAVLHDREITYSVVLPTAMSLGSDTLTEHYRRIGLALRGPARPGLAVQPSAPVRPEARLCAASRHVCRHSPL